MNDLFKKLNVLIKAGLNDVIGDITPGGGGRREPVPPQRLGKDIDREIAALRKRVDEAIAFENELKARAASLEADMARWDQEADDAVARGQEAASRYAIEQMQRAQQRLTMAQSDLREHQLVTQELIMRVNQLEAVVADARRAQGGTPQQGTAAASPVDSISDVLRSAREKIAGLGATATAKDEVQAASAEARSAAVDDAIRKAKVEDDLEARRQRLSKRD